MKEVPALYLAEAATSTLAKFDPNGYSDVVIYSCYIYRLGSSADGSSEERMFLRSVLQRFPLQYSCSRTM